jgi:hypothetical protein
MKTSAVVFGFSSIFLTDASFTGLAFVFLTGFFVSGGFREKFFFHSSAIGEWV